MLNPFFPSPSLSGLFPSMFSFTICSLVPPLWTSFFLLQFWKDLTPQMYITFWMLSLYDVEVPINAYTNVLQRLRSTVEEATLKPSQRAKEMERIAAVGKKVIWTKRNHRVEKKYMSFLEWERWHNRTPCKRKNPSIDTFPSSALIILISTQCSWKLKSKHKKPIRAM